MSRLHQIIAVVKDRKKKGKEDLTAAYQVFQKTALFEGRTRTYKPHNDDGDRFPPESTRINATVGNILRDINDSLVQMLDTCRTQDEGNMLARADVVLPDKTVLLESVPATHLLYLEHFANDVLTAVKAIPTLDPTVDWAHDENTGLFRSKQPILTVKTQKQPQVVVKAEATPHHPAQTEVYHVDRPVGEWTEYRFSGALEASDRAAIIRRVMEFRDAVRQARENANSTEVQQFKTGERVLEYLFDGPVLPAS